jgi:cell division protein FtsI (penicillin-binding protein 3)
MTGVTQEGGTGVKAVPEGYTAAGKTGTAQVLDPQTRRYSTSKWTSIFTGFIPADRPRLVMTVVIHDPRGASYGGVVAAPVFRNISARALPYLGILPASGSPSLPPGVRMANTGHNKTAKTTPSSNEKKGTVGAVDSSSKDPKGATKAPAPTAVNPKLQPIGKTVTVSASIDEMIKPKTQVDLVMNRVP